MKGLNMQKTTIITRKPNGEPLKTIEGYEVSILDFQVVVHNNGYSWNASEATTGTNLGVIAPTRKQAIINAQERIEEFGVETTKNAIASVLAQIEEKSDKSGKIDLVESPKTDFYFEHDESINYMLAEQFNTTPTEFVNPF